MTPFLNVYDFGAVGDGRADDTAAFQAALSDAARTGRTVWIAPGLFRVGELEVPPQVCLRADKTWGFRQPFIGRTVLVQKSEEQSCILDVTHATGSTLTGLSLYGANLPGGCCGIRSRKIPEKPEDVMWIDTCRVSDFTGCAVHIQRAFCISVRHSMFAFCEEDGFRLHGWDAFLSDNFFSFNRGWGFSTDGENSAVTFTANRVEWNTLGGARICEGSHYQLVGNYFDRSGGPALSIGEESPQAPVVHTIACTGNIFYRSGRDAGGETRQVELTRCAGVNFTGNVLCVGADDRMLGRVTPRYGLVLRELTNCVVSHNTLYAGACEQGVLDLGGHTGSVIADNPCAPLRDADGEEAQLLRTTHRRLLERKQQYDRWEEGRRP